MGAVATTISANMRRRRLQSVTLALVLLLACASATLALSILVESQAPFDTAFAAANGAHLVIEYDSNASADALAATGHSPYVTAAAGPWPVTQAMVGYPKGGSVFGAILSGRPAPQALIDQASILAGRWWQAPGEAVLGQSTARLLEKGVGDTVSVTVPTAVTKGAPSTGQPPSAGATYTFTVVGIAQSVSTPSVAVWMSPSDVAKFSLGGPPSQQMLYRVHDASTAGALAAAAASITAGLPADLVRSTATYLEAKGSVDGIAQLYVPVLLAFAAFALLAAAFTISNIVSGVVMTGYREIGVMKAIGFTPRQVATILVGQILVPVTIGAVCGVVVGTIASLPTVRNAAESFGLPATSAVSVEVIAAVLAIGILTAATAAMVPAIRAGRISSVAAISHGLAPSTGAAGRGARRLGMRLPVGLPVRLGVSSGLAHRARATMTFGALVVGVAAVTLAIGLNWSLLRVKEDLDRGQASPVRAELGGGFVPRPGNAAPSDPTAGRPTDITAAITADPQTGRLVSIGTTQGTAAGLGKVQFVGYDGDASWIGYEMIAGRWFTAPGEAVAPTSVFTDTGLPIGGSLTIRGGGGDVTVRLVGEVFDTERTGDSSVLIRGTWTDLLAVDPSAQASAWEMQPATGVEARPYANQLRSSVAGVDISVENEPSADASFLLFLAVIGMMGIVLAAISLGGVFNTVLLETRQRTREMAVLKAIGLTPAQTIAMVLASIVPIGLVAGLVGVPLGLVAQHAVLGYMGQVAAQTRVPPSVFEVFGPLALIGLALTGLGMGVVGALGPAARAARARIAPVLQAE